MPESNGLVQQIEFVGQPTSKPGSDSGAKTANAIGLLPPDNKPLRKPTMGVKLQADASPRLSRWTSVQPEQRRNTHDK
jgi:hypothetical protein